LEIDVRQQAVREAVYLLAKHLFGLHYRRIEWLVDPTDPYRRDAEALGFTLEGVLRKHLIVQGRSRDSAVMSVINSDWREGEQAHAEGVLYGPQSRSRHSQEDAKNIK
jgi:RimJ/RimL family protein N-acetyltransferase